VRNEAVTLQTPIVMKLTLIKTITVSALVFTAVNVFNGCKKSKDETAAVGFKWTHNGAVKEAGAYEAYISTANGLALAPFTIIAGDPRSSLSLSRLFTLSLSAFTTGNYAISNGSGAVNKLLFIDNAGYYHFGVSGSVTITEYSGKIISGNFSITLDNGSAVLTQLTGSFTKVPVYP
jgi:hypothetical protein